MFPSKETEAAAFNLVTKDLEEISTSASRIRALGRNHDLWSLLVKDLALAENRLPAPLKAELINTGLWSMRYSTLAVLKDLPIEPLTTVNRNILSGLLEQASKVPVQVGSPERVRGPVSGFA